MKDFWVQDGETMLFIGDSITDCGRRRKGLRRRIRLLLRGRNEHDLLGNGYVHLFSELATARFPKRRIRYVNMGISGDTAPALLKRWK